MRISDWSSVVCSSDLNRYRGCRTRRHDRFNRHVSANNRRRGPYRARPLYGSRSVAARRHEAVASSSGDGREYRLSYTGGRQHGRHNGEHALPNSRNQGRRPANCRTCREANLRSEEHTSELQTLMRNSYAVFCLKKKKITKKEEK